MAVAHILRQKGTSVYTVEPGDSVQIIVDMLARHRIGAVVVVDAAGGVMRAGRSPGADGLTMRCYVGDSALAAANPSCASPPCDVAATAFAMRAPSTYNRRS